MHTVRVYFVQAAVIVDVLWASSQRMMVTFPLKACATFDVPEEFVVERAPEEVGALPYERLLSAHVWAWEVLSDIRVVASTEDVCM